jgi:hypothetical protein
MQPAHSLDKPATKFGTPHQHPDAQDEERAESEGMREHTSKSHDPAAWALSRDKPEAR